MQTKCHDYDRDITTNPQLAIFVRNFKTLKLYFLVIYRNITIFALQV